MITMSKMTVIPFVIGVLGRIPKCLVEELEDLEIRGRIGDIPDYSIIKIGRNTKKIPEDLIRLAVTQNTKKSPIDLIRLTANQNTKKSPRDLIILAVTQTTVKDHQLIMV